MNPTNQNNSSYFRHSHNGVDSERINFTDLNLSNPPSLSIVDNTTLTSGGAGALTTPDSFALANVRTRVNEIEARLIELGILQ